MIPWGWLTDRDRSPGAHALGWLRPLSAAVPWVTVLLLLQMLVLVGGTFTSAKGVLFDLPEGELAEGAGTKLVALVMPMPHETLVFFDDARYTLGDEVSSEAFVAQLAERAAKLGEKTVLVLADRRVAGGELMKLAGIIRRGGIERVLFAEKSARGGGE